jgi:hypothetical protein
VKPSRTEATRPAGAKSCGEIVASADGEAKLPVMLTMVQEDLSFLEFSVLLSAKPEG